MCHNGSYYFYRFLLPKDIQQLLEDRVKTFNNMAQVSFFYLEIWKLEIELEVYLHDMSWISGSDEAYCLGYGLGKHTSGAEDFFFNLCSELYLPTAFQVLKIQPNNEKALFRKAKILQEKHQLDEAIGFHSKLGLVWNSTSLGILRRINRLYPANKQCHTELAKLTNKVCVRSLSISFLS